MQKWEYLEVYFMESRGLSNLLPGDLKVTAVNGKELKDRRPSYQETANQLGDEGWELVNVMHATVNDKARAFFKRPKEQHGDYEQ
jgi:hypothetical protein